jgi:hypothetical protein
VVHLVYLVVLLFLYQLLAKLVILQVGLTGWLIPPLSKILVKVQLLAALAPGVAQLL